MYVLKYKETGRFVARDGIKPPATFKLEFAHQFNTLAEAREGANGSPALEPVKVTQKMEREAGKAAAVAALHEILKPGDTVTGLVRNVSRSGMSRQIDFYANDPKGGLRYISGLVAEACGYSRTRDGALIVGGCGMNMIFAVVYDLCRVMYRDGFGLKPYRFKGKEFDGERRPQSRAEAVKMIAQGYEFRGRNSDASGWDNDGGYALHYGSM